MYWFILIQILPVLNYFMRVVEAFMHLFVQSNNKIQFRTYSSTYNYEYAYSTTALVPGVWYHVAATFSASNDQLRLYINGTAEDTEAL